jgi:hypothetical protein
LIVNRVSHEGVSKRLATLAHDRDKVVCDTTTALDHEGNLVESEVRLVESEGSLVKRESILVKSESVLEKARMFS